MIMLNCLVHAGQAYWLVLMDTQRNMMVVVIVLKVVKMEISKQQPLSFMEWRQISDYNS